MLTTAWDISDGVRLNYSMLLIELDAAGLHNFHSLLFSKTKILFLCRMVCTPHAANRNYILKFGFECVARVPFPFSVYLLLFSNEKKANSSNVVVILLLSMARHEIKMSSLVLSVSNRFWNVIRDFVFALKQISRWKNSVFNSIEINIFHEKSDWKTDTRQRQTNEENEKTQKQEKMKKKIFDFVAFHCYRFHRLL